MSFSATIITETKWMSDAIPACSFGGRTSSDGVRGRISTSGSACVTPDSSPTPLGCGGDERKTQGGFTPLKGLTVKPTQYTSPSKSRYYLQTSVAFWSMSQMHVFIVQVGSFHAPCAPWSAAPAPFSRNMLRFTCRQRTLTLDCLKVAFFYVPS